MELKYVLHSQFKNSFHFGLKGVENESSILNKLLTKLFYVFDIRVGNVSEIFFKKCLT